MVPGLHLLRVAHLGRRLMLVRVMLCVMLWMMLMSMLDVVSMCHALLHLLQLLLDGLRHGAPGAVAIDHHARSREINMGRQAGRAAGAVVVFHAGLDLGFTVSILVEVRLHGRRGGGGCRIILGTHRGVFENGAGVYL
jgi:hypothetical protein